VVLALRDPAWAAKQLATLQHVGALTDSHGIPAEEAADVPITGTPTRAAERFAAYADAGATWLVLTAIDDDWHAQWELIAEGATLLD
jgi:alkanesulfonate monooxygenase SsuD/methylene tetrahydromethanopterin reductase-like flavin-dependent oxidoreductase (luciferase family)